MVYFKYRIDDEGVIAMKKFIKPFWPLLLMPVLYIPYRLFNEFVLVDWLGCGCSDNAFNANDFTLLFWSAVVVLVFSLSLKSVKSFPKRIHQILAIVAILGISATMALTFYSSMMWK